MSKVIAVLAVGMMLAVCGCKSESKDSSEPKKMSMSTGTAACDSNAKCSMCDKK